MTRLLTPLSLTTAVFTAPSFRILTDLVTEWICAPERRTVTNIITAADAAGGYAHDANHGFLCDGTWSLR